MTTLGSFHRRTSRRLAAILSHRTIIYREISSSSSFSTSLNRNNHRLRRQRRDKSTSQSMQPAYRDYARNSSFRRELNAAVLEGNAVKAEQIVNSHLKEQQQEQRPLDVQLFSLVLQAWKNACVNDHQIHPREAASRAHKLLKQISALANEGIIQEQPSLDDYHTVLECWNFACSQPTFAITKHVQEILEEISHPTTRTYELACEILDGDSGMALLFNKVNTNKVQPTLNMYNSILSAFTVSKDPNTPPKATKLLNYMRKNSVKPNGTSYNSVIECWTKSNVKGAVNQAENVLNQMKRDKVQRTCASYTLIIDALAKMGEAKRAEELITQLIKDYGGQFDADLKPGLEPFQSVLWAYSKSYHTNAAQRATAFLANMNELYQSQVLDTKPNIWSYNIVLKCWSQSNKHSPDPPQKAKELYDEMLSSPDILPDSTSMNTVLNTWAMNKTKTANQTEDLFWKFYHAYVQDPLQHPQPNTISFGTVMKAWALAASSSRSSSGKDLSKVAPQQAEALFYKLEELHQSGWEQCKPDAVTYANLIQCWGKSKQRVSATRAEEILRKMMQSGTDIVPDTVCWNSAINAWAQVGNGERSERLFQEMLANYMETKDERQRPNAMTFTAVLSGWAKTRFNKQAPQRAEKVLNQMEELYKSGILPEDAKPNCVSYSILLDCLAYRKNRSSAEKAEKILCKMKESDDVGLKPNVISYNAVIKAWSYTRDPQAFPRVTALLQELLVQSETNSRMMPNANTFGSVLKALADSKLPDKQKRAQAVLELMEKFGVEMNGWSRNQLEKCMAQEPSSTSHHEKHSELPELPELKYS